MKRLLLIPLSLTLSTQVIASYKDYAKQRQAQTRDITKGASPALVPGFKTARPAEVKLDNPGSLKSASDHVFQTNPNAATLKQSIETRPYFVIDMNKDPIVRNSQASISDPERVLRSKLFSRSSGTGYIYKTCKESKPPVEFKCSKTLIPPTMHITPAKYSNYWCGSGNHRPDDPRCAAKIYYPVAKMYEAEKVQITPEQWSSDCGTMDTKNRQCRLIKETCPKGPETRVITATEGAQRIPVQRSITRDCWRYEYTYECSYGFSKACESLRKSTCEQMGSKCVAEREGVCIEWEQTYRCPTKQNIRQELVSSGRFALPKADSAPSSKPNADMQEAISKLSILKNIQDEMRASGALNNVNGLQIFKGDNRRCTIGFAKFKNCCVKKGWGLKVGLSHCNAEEKDLAQRQKKTLCVKVGTYCAQKILGQCIRKKTSYCCFPTKLSRILQVQGRGQLGIGWGEPKEPQCRGFTVDELSRLDFEKLDLSELFAEITAKAKQVTQSTVNTVTRNLSSRVTQIGQDFKPHQLKNEANKPQSGEF
jgi:hypothetical protein